MAQRTAVKTTYDIERTLQPIYSGGSIALSEDGRILAACLGEDALLTDVTNGRELGRVEGVRGSRSCFPSVANQCCRMENRSLLLHVSCHFQSQHDACRY